jgi:hypothetical protein
MSTVTTKDGTENMSLDNTSRPTRHNKHAIKINQCQGAASDLF